MNKQFYEHHESTLEVPEKFTKIGFWNTFLSAETPDVCADN